MKFTVFSDKGGLVDNEDFVGSAFENGIYCFAAADGLGSHNGGALASKLAVSAIISEFKKEPELSPQKARLCMDAAQELITTRRTASPEVKDMAASAVMLMTDGASAVWAHVGDSRLYVFKRGKIIEVTDDHTTAFESFLKGDIEYGEIRESRGRNRLRRAVGDKVSYEPDISDLVKINSGFSFLMCTNGFWENIYETEMEEALRFSFSSKAWLEKMLNKIMPKIETGSDNLSAVAVKMQMGDSI